VTSALLLDCLPVETAGRRASAEEWYLDASALVKLVILDERSSELRRWMLDLESRGGRAFISELARTEADRALMRAAPEWGRLSGSVLDGFDRVEVAGPECIVARVMPSATLRTLDALHLAVVIGHAAPVAGIVTYDRWVVEAAGTIGVRAISP